MKDPELLPTAIVLPVYDLFVTLVAHPYEAHAAMHLNLYEPPHCRTRLRST